MSPPSHMCICVCTDYACAFTPQPSLVSIYICTYRDSSSLQASVQYEHLVCQCRLYRAFCYHDRRQRNTGKLKPNIFSHLFVSVSLSMFSYTLVNISGKTKSTSVASVKMCRCPEGHVYNERGGQMTCLHTMWLQCVYHVLWYNLVYCIVSMLAL